MRNGGPRRTLFLSSGSPPEILGLPGKPHVTARTLPWTSAARVRPCRADECHRIFGSVFGLRNARDHHFSVHFFWYDSRKTREQGNTEFDCCLQGFFFLITINTKELVPHLSTSFLSILILLASVVCLTLVAGAVVSTKRPQRIQPKRP